MGFILDTGNTYLWPVKISMPSDGGQRVEQTFDARFKRLPQKRINQIQQQANGLMAASERGEDISNEISDQSIADEILDGWEGITDANGNDIPVTKTTKKQLLDVPMMASTLVETYFLSLVEEKRKN